MKLPYCKDMLASGLTNEQLAEKYGVPVEIIKKKIQGHIYRTTRTERAEPSELAKLIYARGYTYASLADRINYSRSSISTAMRKGVSLQLLNAMIEPLKLTDNEVVRIVKGELI